MKITRILFYFYTTVLLSMLLATFTLTATESVSNDIPVFTSNPNIKGKEGMPYTYKAKASCIDNDVLEYYLLIYPEGMNIELSTGLINWVPESPGSYDVIVKASDIKKSISATQEFTIVVEKALLTSIKVLPSTVMYLDMNESKPIQSVTAYYDNNTSKEIELANCSYESDHQDIATVDNNGTVTGITNIISIPATITVSYSEENISKNDIVLVVVNPPFIVFRGMDQACAF